MTRAGATIELGRPDEETDSAASELVVTITLKLGSGPASPEAMRLTELLERFVAGEDETPSTTVAMQDDPDVVTVFADARTVMRGAEELALTRREFDLLLCLAENPARVFTREQLLAMVWKNEDTGPRSVDVHVLRLRSKVGFDVPLVLTLRGVGYRLHAQARVTVVRGHRL